MGPPGVVIYNKAILSYKTGAFILLTHLAFYKNHFKYWPSKEENDMASKVWRIPKTMNLKIFVERVIAL